MSVLSIFHFLTDNWISEFLHQLRNKSWKCFCFALIGSCFSFTHVSVMFLFEKKKSYNHRKPFPHVLKQKPGTEETNNCSWLLVIVPRIPCVCKVQPQSFHMSVDLNPVWIILMWEPHYHRRQPQLDRHGQ